MKSCGSFGGHIPISINLVLGFVWFLNLSYILISYKIDLVFLFEQLLDYEVKQLSF